MTDRLILVIGNKRWSSRSLRPGNAVTQAGILFNENHVPPRTAEAVAPKRRLCPSGTAPVLHHAGFAIWEPPATHEYTG